MVEYLLGFLACCVWFLLWFVIFRVMLGSFGFLLDHFVLWSVLFASCCLWFWLVTWLDRRLNGGKDEK